MNHHLIYCFFSTITYIAAIFYIQHNYKTEISEINLIVDESVSILKDANYALTGCIRVLKELEE